MNSRNPIISNTTDRRGANRVRRLGRFTLLEVLVSAALLVVLCFLLFSLFSRLQVAYSHSLRVTNAAENARLAFDVVARDLETAVSREDDIPGCDIEFHQPEPSKLWFVCGGLGADQSVSGLIEVAYRLENGNLQRAFVDDSCPEWNVYGPRDDADDQDGYHTIIDGVIDLQFICYGQHMIPYQPRNANQLPYIVTISLTLLDSDSYRQWKRASAARREEIEKEAARTFKKSIYLGGSGGGSST